MTDLPQGWAARSLGSVLRFNYGKSLPAHAREAGLVTVYGSNGPVGFHSKALIEGPAIIVGRKGSIGEVHYSTGPRWPIDTTYFIDDFRDHSPQFWFWYIKHLRFDSLDRASAIPGLNREDAYQSTAFVPPLQEQRRIVAKLDRLFERTKTAREELARIPRLVERYKQAALAAAFRGDATRKWRAAHPSTQSASLVKRQNTRGFQRREGSNSPADSSQRTPLPGTWRAVTVDSIGEVILGRQRSPENYTGPCMRPYIRAANIKWDGWDVSDVKEMNFDERDFAKFKLQTGDVLINEGSGSAAEVGKPAIWKDQIKNCCFQNTLIAVRPHSVSSEFLYYVLLSAARSKAFVDQTRGVNIHHIGRAGLAQFVIPLPPRDEQEEIVNQIRAALKVIDRLLIEATSASELLNRFEQATLAKAFRGELLAMSRTA